MWKNKSILVSSILALTLIIPALIFFSCGVKNPAGSGIVIPTYNPTAPSITSFSPLSGPVGTTVTIAGTNFSATAASNAVKFNNVTAVVSAVTATTITTTVPATATTGPITVTVNGVTATSAVNFIVGTSPPTGVTATTASSTQIDINWTLVSGATSYNIYRSTSAGVALIPANKVNTGTIVAGPFANSGLTPNTLYYYVVTAIAPNGESGASTEVSATTNMTAPSAPTGVTATAASPAR